MSKKKHSPDNQLGKRLQGKKKQGKKQNNLIDLGQHEIEPTPINKGENTVVPFESVIRIQKDYFYEYKDELVVMNKQEVSTDYGNDAPKRVRKYLKFVNVPSHTNYQKDIGKNYNLYRPLPHKPKMGDWFHIEKMLRHIFRGKHYEMILTYFWVLYMKPTHPLPFIALVSSIKGTGKTKLLQLLKVIFGENAKFIDPEVLSGNFNSSYIDKLCVLLDEKIDGKHRKSDLQKLKKFITGGTQNRKAKYQHDVDVDSFLKFFMCGNDIDTMLALEKENTRFWIIEVPKIEIEDIDILEKAIIEIPAFLYFLETEYKPMPRKSRLWFSPEDIQTERGRIMQQNSRPEVAKEIEERLINYFVEHEHRKEIYFSAEHFLTIYKIPNVNGNYFGRVMTTEFSKKSTIIVKANPFFNDTLKIKCRCYHFHRDEIIKEKAQDIVRSDKLDSEFYDPDWIDGEFE